MEDGLETLRTAVSDQETALAEMKEQTDILQGQIDELYGALEVPADPENPDQGEVPDQEGIQAQISELEGQKAALEEQIQAVTDSLEGTSNQLAQQEETLTPLIQQTQQAEGVVLQRPLAGGRPVPPEPAELSLRGGAGTNLLVSPVPLLGAADGIHRKHKDAAGRKQVTTAKNAKMRDMRTILASCMEGDVRRMPATGITCETTASQYVVTATLPTGKENKSGIVRVVASYDKADGSIATLYTEEADGTSNTYTLTDKRLNEEIDETTFNL